MFFFSVFPTWHFLSSCPYFGMSEPSTTRIATEVTPKIWFPTLLSSSSGELFTCETPLPNLVNEWMIEWREGNKDQHSWLCKSNLKCSIQTEARFLHRNTGSIPHSYTSFVPELKLYTQTLQMLTIAELQSSHLLCCLCHHPAFLIYFTFSL